MYGVCILLLENAETRLVELFKACYDVRVLYYFWQIFNDSLYYRSRLDSRYRLHVPGYRVDICPPSYFVHLFSFNGYFHENSLPVTPVRFRSFCTTNNYNDTTVYFIDMHTIEVMMEQASVCRWSPFNRSMFIATALLDAPDDEGYFSDSREYSQRVLRPDDRVITRTDDGIFMY
jgi:hypothetical protein